jgi:hypothetical protein
MKNSNLTSFRDHLDEQYGKEGTKSRTEYVMIVQERKIL